MIAVDTNAWRHYLRGVIDSYTPLIAEAISYGDAVIPPIALTESLSYREITPEDIRETLSLPLLPLRKGYWYRAGLLRRELLLKHRSAPIADCLIAQACIDSNVPLITYDNGFTRFVEAGLELL